MTFPITMSELQDRGHADLADYVNYLVSPSPFWAMDEDGDGVNGVTITFNVVDGIMPDRNGMLNDLIGRGIDVRQTAPMTYRLIVTMGDAGCQRVTCHKLGTSKLHGYCSDECWQADDAILADCFPNEF